MFEFFKVKKLENKETILLGTRAESRWFFLWLGVGFCGMLILNIFLTSKIIPAIWLIIFILFAMLSSLVIDVNKIFTKD